MPKLHKIKFNLAYLKITNNYVIEIIAFDYREIISIYNYL